MGVVTRITATVVGVGDPWFMGGVVTTVTPSVVVGVGLDGAVVVVVVDVTSMVAFVDRVRDAITR